MSNFKTTIVVGLLLAILYGVYTVLQQPPLQPPKDFNQQQDGELDLSIEDNSLDDNSIENGSLKSLEEPSTDEPVSTGSGSQKSTSRGSRFDKSKSLSSETRSGSSRDTRFASSNPASQRRGTSDSFNNRTGDSLPRSPVKSTRDTARANERRSRDGNETALPGETDEAGLAVADPTSLPDVPPTDPAATEESMAEVPPPELAPRQPRRTSPMTANEPANPTRRASLAEPASSSRNSDYESVRQASSESPLGSDRGNYAAREPGNGQGYGQGYGQGNYAPETRVAVPDDDRNASPDMPRIQYNPFVTSNERKSGITPATEYANRMAYEQALKNGRLMIAEQRWREALLTLSVAYDAPGLSRAQREQLLELLDPLAGKVIYSSEHLVEPAHVVRRGETLQDIADQYNVPWQLLQKINEVRDPEYPIPASSLKVMRGPFQAVVDMSAGEITLKLNRMYAGRFPISIGRDPEPLAGEYQVREKAENQPYYSSDGKTIAGDDPNNPFGRHWINLGREVAIHGSSLTNEDPELGSISLSPKDADDIFSILSVGSKVTIRR